MTTKMKISNLTETVIEQVATAKQQTKNKLFTEWETSRDPIHREEIYAKLKVLDDLTFALNKNIRGDFDDNI